MNPDYRIVHLAKYLPAFAGGMETVTHEFTQAAVAAGMQVAIVGVDPSRSSRAGFPLEGVEQVPLPSHGQWGPVPLAPAFFRLAGYLNKTDLVHIHLPNPFAELALLKHLATTPHADWPCVVPIVHAPILRWAPLGAAWQLLVHRPLLERSSAFIAASQQLIDTVGVYRQFSRKGVIIPFPTGAAMVKPPGTQAATPTVLAVGRLVPYKGFDLLLRALAQLAQPWQLIIVGEGPERTALQNLAQGLGIKDRVTFRGRVDEQQKQQLLSTCDLLAAPSRTSAEAYGIVIAEAFAHGKPVVTTSLPTGVAFLARGGACGGICAPDSVSGLASALSLLLTDHHLRWRCGNDNLRFWQRELTRTRFTERYRHAIATVTGSLGWRAAS